MLPSWAMTGPVNGEPVVEIVALAASTSYLVSSVTEGPNFDCTKGFSPSL